MTPAANRFHAAREALALRAESHDRRRRRFHRSRLDRNAHELIALRAEGATAAEPAELRRWLARRGARVAHSTVSRWLRRQDA